MNLFASVRAKTNYKNEKFLKKFGKRLREMRKIKGLSQEELAYKSGFELSQIGRIERAEINTSLSHVSALAEALGIDPIELFDFN
jgi:transcriptional regulator with XRE-family HTH domain